VTVKHKRFWQRWHLHERYDAKRRLAAAIAKYEEVCKFGDDGSAEPLAASREMFERGDEIDHLAHESLLRSAKRYSIYIPPRFANPKAWMPCGDSKLFVLTEELAHSVRSQIFQKRIVYLGILFGISSVIQTVFTVLSYFIQLHPPK
jgi:hypothetical protein